MSNEPVSPSQTFEPTKAPQPAGPSGWVCPVCGSGLSPFMTRCPCVPYVQSFPVYPTFPGTMPYAITHNKE